MPYDAKIINKYNKFSAYGRYLLMLIQAPAFTRQAGRRSYRDTYSTEGLTELRRMVRSPEFFQQQGVQGDEYG
jgi:hypothetical protein